jgi:hypothetical protein
MFANNAQLKKQQSQIQITIRIPFRCCNAGYSTNDPKLALEQMLEDNMIYQKDTFDIDYRLH